MSFSTEQYTRDECCKELPKHPWEVWYAAYIEARMQDAGGESGVSLAQHRASMAVKNWLSQQKNAEAATRAFQGEN